MKRFLLDTNAAGLYINRRRGVRERAIEEVARGNRVGICVLFPKCLNTALEAAANEPLPANRVFSPQNWIKTKACLAGIRAAIQQYFTMLPAMPGGKELSQKLRAALAMDPGQFEARWAAD